MCMVWNMLEHGLEHAGTCWSIALVQVTGLMPPTHVPVPVPSVPQRGGAGVDITFGEPAIPPYTDYLAAAAEGSPTQGPQAGAGAGAGAPDSSYCASPAKPGGGVGFASGGGGAAGRGSPGPATPTGGRHAVQRSGGSGCGGGGGGAIAWAAAPAAMAQPLSASTACTR